MKFTFFYDVKGDKKNKKKKQQVIKAKTKEELLTVAKIAKCEITKNSILSDIDFNKEKLLCEYKDKIYTMKELWSLLSKKLHILENVNKNKSKESDEKTKKLKNKKKNKKKSNKKKSSKNKKSNDNKYKQDTNNGLVRIRRRES